MATVYEIVSDPSRRVILDLLRERERPVGDLVDRMSISQPGVSKHLRVLRNAGLVAVRGDKQRRLYRINPGPLKEIDHWLAPYREFWESRLDLLGAHLDTMADTPAELRSETST